MDLGRRLTQGRLLTWLQLLFINSCLYERPDPTAGAMSTIWQAILADPDEGRDKWRTMILKEELKLGPDLARALTPASRVPSDDLAAAGWIDRFFEPPDESAHGGLANLLIDIQQNPRRAEPAPTHRGVAQLVIELLAPLTGTLYDPAFGMGTILASGWNMKKDDQLTICGQEVSVFCWQISFLRLLLHGAEPELRTGDTLLDDQFGLLKADRIAIEPPWGVSGEAVILFHQMTGGRLTKRRETRSGSGSITCCFTFLIRVREWC